jgi:alkylation response protein AidB-like acyl-CoA dehydrogenase
MVEYLLATDDQKTMAENARKILEKELPFKRLEELEKADEGRGQYPLDVHKTMAEKGYCGMNIPEEWGGLGLDVVTLALIFEQMAKVDAGFTFSFSNAGGFFPLIAQTGISKQEKQKWADNIMAGDSIGAFAITEAEAGSDATAMRTTAVKKGHEWVINGTKCFISNGPIADHFIVAAWDDKTKRASQGITAFFVEKDRGVQVGKKENKMGLKLSETSEIILDNVSVPEDHVIGEVGHGFVKALATISGEGRGVGMSYPLGLAQAALDYAIDYAKERRQFGKRIIDHQGLGFLIADMQARTDVSRAMLYYTLNCLKAGINIGRLSSVLKVTISDNTMQTTVDAVQVLGGYGYMKDYPVEKFMRDAKIFQIFSGSNQIQRNTIAKSLAGKDTK